MLRSAGAAGAALSCAGVAAELSVAAEELLDWSAAAAVPAWSAGAAAAELSVLVEVADWSVLLVAAAVPPELSVPLIGCE